MVLVEVVRNRQRPGVNVGEAGQTQTHRLGGRAGGLNRHAQRAQRLAECGERIVDGLSHERPAQDDAALGHALTGGGAFLIVDQLPQRLQRPRLGVAQAGNHAVAIGVDQRNRQLGQRIGLRRRGVETAAVLNTAGQHHQIAGLWLQRQQGMNVQRGLIGVLRQQIGLIIDAGAEFMMNGADGERGRRRRVQERVDQLDLEHPHRAARLHRAGVERAGKRSGQRRDRREPVQSVQRDLRIGQIVWIRHRDIQRPIDRAVKQ